jgi:wyosine [tRNA(Phe)-imidazoG37] synthetase (radical SAM superfamily)
MWRLRRSAPLPPDPIPVDFDWRSYLERYPDLGAAGIATEEAAAEHWRHWGAAEGRWATGASYPTRSTLACSSIHSLYLRATGTLVCWDDAGNDTVLQAFDPAVHYGRDVYLGPVFNRLRHTLSEGRMPFPDVCQKCLVLRSGTPHSSFHLDQRVAEVFQVEPSYRCTLDCPGCVPLAVRKLAPPQNLPAPILEKILRDFVDSRIRVRAFDFQGHGEPLLHPGLWDLVRTVKRHYPESYAGVTTNAHGVVREGALSSGVDEVVCSIDGVDQETFAPYRVAGRFDLAYRFLSDFARGARRAGARTRVVWKYILFAHNSAPEHLERAQRLARAAEVHELAFVFTRNGPRSTRVTEPAQVPLVDGGPTVTFRHHEPAADDLANRLATARVALAEGEPARAAELAASVARNLDRFFPEPEDLTPAHQGLLADLRTLAAELPASERRAVEATLERLGATPRGTAPPPSSSPAPARPSSSGRRTPAS